MHVCRNVVVPTLSFTYNRLQCCLRRKGMSANILCSFVFFLGVVSVPGPLASGGASLNRANEASKLPRFLRNICVSYFCFSLSSSAVYLYFIFISILKSRLVSIELLLKGSYVMELGIRWLTSKLLQNEKEKVLRFRRRWITCHEAGQRTLNNWRVHQT